MRAGLAAVPAEAQVVVVADAAHPLVQTPQAFRAAVLRAAPAQLLTRPAEGSPAGAG